MTETNRRPVASLWIGKRLNYLNVLCLRSHIVAGHPTTLYTVDTLENPPEGVEIRPASEIMALDMDIVRQTNESFLSNVFRYKMIQKTGAIWIDCDAFCHKPFPEDTDWIFGMHGMQGALNCGVVMIPRECELMDQLLDYYDNLPPAPPWWRKHQIEKLERLEKERRDMPHPVRIFKTERTAFGPQAFTHFATKTGDIKRAFSRDVLYPVPFQLNDVFYDPYGHVEGHFTDKTISVHLYTNGTKPYWEENPPLPNSYVARMCERVGVDPKDALGK